MLSEAYPLFDDEKLYSYWIDQQMGGQWNEDSPKRWVSEGWEPPFYCQRRQFWYHENAPIVERHA